MSKQTMGEFLALLRRANGFTQQEVADKLNISNRTLSSWETDRTTPDILLLPSIADLYGITVDELLRCERSTSESGNKKISEDALRSARKHRLGKFSAKSLLLSLLGCFGAVMVALTFIFWLYAGCPTWLFILLLVLSSCDIVVCGTILFYSYSTAKTAEGLILQEDYTEETKSYALTLKHRSAKFFLFCSLPLIIFTFAMGIAMIIINPYNYEILGVTINVVGAYAATICTTGGLGIVFLIAYFVYSNANFTSLANETQSVTHKHNAKLLGKLVGFGAIPIALCFILMIVLETTSENLQVKNIYMTDNFEDFQNYMQTLVVKETAAKVCDIEAGEYLLTFPEEPELWETYDLGTSGFEGRYALNSRYQYGNEYYYYCYEIRYKMSEIDHYYFFGEYQIDGFIINDTKYQIVNLRTPCQDLNYLVDYGTGITQTVDHVIITPLNETDDYAVIDYPYRYQRWYQYDFGGFPYFMFLTASSATIATCSIIYAVKRKKQNFEF